MATTDKELQDFLDLTKVPLNVQYPELGETFDELPMLAQSGMMAQVVAQQMGVRPSGTDGLSPREHNELLRKTLMAGAPDEKMAWQPAAYRRTQDGWRD